MIAGSSESRMDLFPMANSCRIFGVIFDQQMIVPPDVLFGFYNFIRSSENRVRTTLTDSGKTVQNSKYGIKITRSEEIQVFDQVIEVIDISALTISRIKSHFFPVCFIK